jgi:hypothetical protein
MSSLKLIALLQPVFVNAPPAKFRHETWGAGKKPGIDSLELIAWK